MTMRCTENHPRSVLVEYSNLAPGWNTKGMVLRRAANSFSDEHGPSSG